jgi:DNA-binding GntR family transcriptional regulator
MPPRTEESKVAKLTKTGPRLVIDRDGPAAEKPVRQNRINLFDLAYERLEELIVTCELQPGRLLTIQDLQGIIGFGRTPIHQAVNRLAGDTLILIRPRHGLRIAPVDLARDRVLLELRRDIERFVVRLATERARASHRSQLLHLARRLRAQRDGMSVAEFNRFDRRLDHLVIAAADEPFLEHTLRPLHTISRRIGWMYHSCITAPVSLHQTIDCHLAIIEAVANRHPEAAAAATDQLIDFADSMFTVMEQEIDPGLLDCSFEPLPER